MQTIKEKMIPAFRDANGGLFQAVEKADVGSAYQDLEKQGVALMGWADPFMPDRSLPEPVAAAWLDAVRAGSALLGRCRRTRNDGLQKVGYGEAGIEEIRWLPKDHTVGNEVLVTLKKPTRIAVLPVGYQNGFGVSRSREAGLWALIRRWWRGKRLYVRIGGQKARIVGRIGAIETLVDVTDLKCTAGDTAVFDLDPLYARGFVRAYRDRPASEEEYL